MNLSPEEIAQLDPQMVAALDRSELLPLLTKVFGDLKELMDRQNQHSGNSSRPSSSDAPWGPRGSSEGKLNAIQDALRDMFAEPENGSTSESQGTDSSSQDRNNNSSSKRNKRGKKKGAQGFARTQKLSVDREIHHTPETCAVCGHALNPQVFVPSVAREQLDLEKGQIPVGLKVLCTKHVYGKICCPQCSHKNETVPKKTKVSQDWSVELKEWRLVGPSLLAFICALSKEYRMSRVKIQGFLWEWLQLELSVGEINRCIHEAGRAVHPLMEEMIQSIRESDLVHSDETPWWEQDKRLWLWIFLSTHTAVFLVGSRGSYIPFQVLQGFAGWLMSDGYAVYRNWLQRLRCWAHLLRKAKGLSESVDNESRMLGSSLLIHLNKLKTSIYKAREGPPPENLAIQENATLHAILKLCLDHQQAQHDKARALSREILRDWVAVFAVLELPEMPLTNNEAERALRHWVINRKVSMGTRSPEGTRALTSLASVIETCKRRGASPWEFLSYVVEERRAGRECPPLPSIPIAESSNLATAA